MTIVPNSEEAKKLLRMNSLGVTIGNFTITDTTLPKSKVRATCNLCGNKDYTGLFYKIKTGHTTSCGCKHKLKDPEQHIGKKFNKLTITGISDKKDNDGAVMAVVKCDCGKSTEKRLNMVLRSKFKACGYCNADTPERKLYDADKQKHARIKDIWRQMLKRCMQSGSYVTDDPRISFVNKEKPHARYKDYGARGIKVSPVWYDFVTFYHWYDKRHKEGLSMDRKDNNVGYSPDNCRMTDSINQNYNKRDNTRTDRIYPCVLHGINKYEYRLRKQKKTILYKSGFEIPEDALMSLNLVVYTKNIAKEIIPVGGKTRIVMLGDDYSLIYKIGGNTYYSRLVLSPDEIDDMKYIVDIMNEMYDKDIESMRTSYKGVRYKRHSYTFEINYTKRHLRISKHGYLSPEEAVLDRNLTLVQENIPLPITALGKFVKTYYDNNANRYRLMYVNDMNTRFLSKISFETKDDPVLVQTIKAMYKGAIKAEQEKLMKKGDIDA